MDQPVCLTAPTSPEEDLKYYLIPGLAVLPVCWFLHRSLASLAAWFAYALFVLTKGSHLGAAMEFFIHQTPKVLKPRLIATFFGVVALGILLVGYLFNSIM